MAMYFFDFRSGDIVSMDDEGLELTDIDAAHTRAIQALADALENVFMQGRQNQHIAVDVRDDAGPVLEVTAVLGSKILRKQ